MFRARLPRERIRCHAAFGRRAGRGMMNVLRRGKHLLVIEDDKTLNHLLVEQLRAMGHQPTGVHSWSEAKTALETLDPSLAVLDIRLPDIDGIECLPELSAQCPVVVLTAFGSIQHAVDSIHAGALEYLTKPVNPSELELAVNRALETSSLKRSYEYCREQLNPEYQQDYGWQERSLQRIGPAYRVGRSK